MSRLRSIAIVLGVQAGLVGLYLGVEHLRREQPPLAVETLDEPAPALSLTRKSRRATVPDAPHLVHFWATWCGPCQEELPALLEAAEAVGVPLLAVTDEPWPVVERYFGGVVPQPIVQDITAEAAATWHVSGLPDTFVVRDGQVVGRMGGPRDWSTTQARDFMRDLRRTR